MKQLAELQHTFQDCVLNPGKARSAAWISAAGRAAPEIQLSVYSHAYVARLREVLANDYPAVLVAVGEDQFNQLADDYIRANPSRYFSLRDFGRHLPGFISGMRQRNAGQQGSPWLRELAVFEWTLGEAFDAADAPVFTEQAMAVIPYAAWPELRFIPHPSVRRLDLEWNIPEMWQALTGDQPVPVTARRDRASPWLVWRKQLATRFRSMQMDEQRALDALRGGGCFGEVCEVLATLLREDEVPLRAAGLLKGWIGQGLISGIE